MKKSRINTRVLLWAGFLVPLAAGLFLAVGHNYRSGQLMQDAQKEARTTVDKIARHFSCELDKIEKNTNDLATGLEKGTIPYDSVESHLKKITEKIPFISGIGAAWAPYKYAPDIELYAPYYIKKYGADSYSLKYLQDFCNYTEDSSVSWYHLALKKDTAWLGPHFDKTNNSYRVEYTQIIKKDNRPVGALWLTYSLQDIQDTMSRISIGSSCYGWIIDAEGKIIYHPDSELVQQKKYIFEIAEKNDIAELSRVSRAGIAGESGIIDYTSPISGLKGKLLYVPIRRGKSALFLLINQNDFNMPTDLVRQHWILVCLLLVLALCFLGMLSCSNCWKRVTVISLALIFGTGSVWFTVMNSSQEPDDTISSKAVREKRQHFIRAKLEKLKEKPVFIPTGLFIQSMEFKDANNIEVSGFVWQKFARDIPPELRQGINFPEGFDITMDVAYQRVFPNYDVTGWYFEMTLRQPFNYSKYPLDCDELWFRFVNKDLREYVVLEPDLDSYKFTAPNLLPGVEKDFVSRGWILEGSYFSLRFNSYNTTFGIYPGIDEFPELYFNILLKRDFLDAFIARLIPIAVLGFLLFLTLLGLTREKDNPMTIMAICSGLFFVVIFEHIGLRNQLATTGVVYLEYFYFILYLLILLLSINSYIFVMADNVKWLHYKNNLLPKLLFWPVFLGFIYLVSIIVYY
ncbi:MAG: hypothetical protein GY757_59705 [bacterium]|nr:hypothetical protein [bacterium]